MGVSPAQAKLDSLLTEINNNSDAEERSVFTPDSHAERRSETLPHTKGFASREAELERKSVSSSHKSSLSVPSRHLSCSSGDSYERRGSASSRSSVDSTDRWSTSKAPTSYVDAFSNSRKPTVTNKFTSSLPSSDFSSGYHTIPPPTSRTHLFTKSSIATDASEKSKYRSSDRTTNFSSPKPYSSPTSTNRTRGYDSSSRSRVPGLFSSASSKRVGDAMDSYRSPFRP